MKVPDNLLFRLPPEKLYKTYMRRLVQVAMLRAALERPERTCTATDASDDPFAKYLDNGPWVGHAVNELRKDGLIVRVGQDASVRKSRHGAEIKLWKVVDDNRARLTIGNFRRWMEDNPLPPKPTVEQKPEQKNPMGATIGRESGKPEAHHAISNHTEAAR